MKVFEIRKEGILGYVGWRKKTLLVFGVPLLSRLSQVLTYKGGGYMKSSTLTNSLAKDNSPARLSPKHSLAYTTIGTSQRIC